MPREAAEAEVIGHRGGKSGGRNPVRAANGREADLHNNM